MAARRLLHHSTVHTTMPGIPLYLITIKYFIIYQQFYYVSCYIYVWLQAPWKRRAERYVIYVIFNTFVTFELWFENYCSVTLFHLLPDSLGFFLCGIIRVNVECLSNLGMEACVSVFDSAIHLQTFTVYLLCFAHSYSKEYFCPYDELSFPWMTSNIFRNSCSLKIDRVLLLQ